MMSVLYIYVQMKFIFYRDVFCWDIMRCYVAVKAIETDLQTHRSQTISAPNHIGPSRVGLNHFGPGHHLGPWSPRPHFIILMGICKILDIKSSCWFFLIILITFCPLLTWWISFEEYIALIDLSIETKLLITIACPWIPRCDNYHAK